MSSNDLNASHLGRLLRSLSTAGLVIGERTEAGEVERLLVASIKRPPRDKLGEMLADIGCRIAQHGAAAEPRIRVLADALRASRPVAAAVLASPAEPDIVRARAFLHLARAAARLPQAQQDILAVVLAMT